MISSYKIPKQKATLNRIWRNAKSAAFCGRAFAKNRKKEERRMRIKTPEKMGRSNWFCRLPGRYSVRRGLAAWSGVFYCSWTWWPYYIQQIWRGFYFSKNKRERNCEQIGKKHPIFFQLSTGQDFSMDAVAPPRSRSWGKRLSVYSTVPSAKIHSTFRSCSSAKARQLS